MVARVSIMLLATLHTQDANHIPMGMMPLSAGVGYLPPWEYYQKNWGWGCAESGWGYTWAFNQLTWWDYNTYFSGAPPEFRNWFYVQSSDAHIKHRARCPARFPPLHVSALWALCRSAAEPAETPETTLPPPLRNAFQDKWGTETLTSSHCFLSPSPPLLIYLSLSLWCQSNCSLFPTPLPQHCCCCCCW